MIMTLMSMRMMLMMKLIVTMTVMVMTMFYDTVVVINWYPWRWWWCWWQLWDCCWWWWRRWWRWCIGGDDDGWWWRWWCFMRRCCDRFDVHVDDDVGDDTLIPITLLCELQLNWTWDLNHNPVEVLVDVSCELGFDPSRTYMSQGQTCSNFTFLFSHSSTVLTFGREWPHLHLLPSNRTSSTPCRPPG